MKRLIALTFALTAIWTVAPRALAQVEGAYIIVAETGEVTATYQGNTASYSNDLYLDSPTNSLGIIFNNHADPVGLTKSLGVFNAGDELLFRLHVNNTGNDFFSGPAFRNADQHAHARVTDNWQPGATLVEFEDLLNGPFVYNDLAFSFTNVKTNPPDIPEPGTLGLLLPGVVAPLAALRRRKA